MLNAAGDNAVFPPTRYVFGSFQATQRVYGAALAEFAAKTLKAKRVAIIVHDDDYGKANLAAAKAVTEKNGGEVVSTERIPPNITDVTATDPEHPAAKPDVIISGAYPAPAVLIAQKYGEFGMTAIPLLQSTQGIPTPPVFAKNVANDAALENFYYTWAFTDVGDQAVHDKWVGMYKKAYPDRDPAPSWSPASPRRWLSWRPCRRPGAISPGNPSYRPWSSSTSRTTCSRSRCASDRAARRAPRRLRDPLRRQDAESAAGRLFLERQGRDLSEEGQARKRQRDEG